MPDKCVEVFNLGYAKKDIASMREYFQAMFPLCDYMAVKGLHSRRPYGGELLGRPKGPPRRPFASCSRRIGRVLAGSWNRPV